LPRLVGRPRAKELIFTGRRIDAEHAEEIGLVNHCVQAGTAYKKALDIGCEIIKQVMTISFPVLSCRLLSPGGRESLVLLLFVG
jgi:enoyl-CoA hydratase/carnithine racemase